LSAIGRSPQQATTVRKGQTGARHGYNVRSVTLLHGLRAAAIATLAAFSIMVPRSRVAVNYRCYQGFGQLTGLAGPV
jgi:hypothetical protein